MILTDRRLLFAEEIMKPSELCEAAIVASRVEVFREAGRIQPVAQCDLIVNSDYGPDANDVASYIEIKTGSVASTCMGIAASKLSNPDMNPEQFYDFKGWTTLPILADSDAQLLQYSFKRQGPPILSWGPNNTKEMIPLMNGSLISTMNAFSHKSLREAIDARPMNIESRFGYIAAAFGGNIEYCCAQNLTMHTNRPVRVVELLINCKNSIARHQTYGMFELLRRIYDLKRGV